MRPEMISRWACSVPVQNADLSPQSCKVWKSKIKKKQKKSATRALCQPRDCAAILLDRGTEKTERGEGSTDDDDDGDKVNDKSAAHPY